MQFFTDPILSAPTWGSMLMGVASALVGVLVYVRKRALIGETLSHATYPGITFAVLLLGQISPIIALIGAFVSGLIGLYLVRYLEEKHNLASDTALCFVLSTFLGMGVLLASRLQFTEPVAFQKIQAMLYGQAATMLLIHVYIYAALVGVIVLFVGVAVRALKVVNFDRDFAKMTGLSLRWIDYATVVLIVLAIVVGIRSVGVVLMAGMLIAPAVIARQFAKTFGRMFLLASLFGVLIGFFGMYVSVGRSWPTGPTILVVATLFVIGALIFSGKRGLVGRVIRRNRFKRQCLEENVLKYLYKKQEFGNLREAMHLSRGAFAMLMMRVRRKGVLQGQELTEIGKKRAVRIIRLHRLWEVYLFTCLDVQAENVHKSAEEMEHSITPELEEELVQLLGDPKKDPHNQEIP